MGARSLRPWSRCAGRLRLCPTPKHAHAHRFTRACALVSSSSVWQLDPVSKQELFTVGFDGTGAITTLLSATSTVSPPSTNWASSGKPLAALVYQTLNESDWRPFTYDYINGCVLAWSVFC